MHTKNIKLLALSVAVVGFAVVAPLGLTMQAQARDSNENSGRKMAYTPDTTDVERETSSLRDAALKKIANEQKEKGKTTAIEKRKAACEQRQENINKKIANFADKAQKHLDTFDGIYDKVTTYKEDKNAQVTNWADLVTAAEDTQKDAAVKVAALKDLAVEVDCSDPATATVKLGAVREAAKSARDALHAYRMAIKDMVVALAQVNKTDDSTGTSEDEGSTSTTTEGTNTDTTGGNQQ